MSWIGPSARCWRGGSLYPKSLLHARADWSLLGISHLEELPAIRWRLQNLETLAQTQPKKLRVLADALAARLD